MTRFDSGETLTFASARDALAAGLSRIADGAREVDCAHLAHFDSAALAVLLAWRRAARERGGALEIFNLPSQLVSLAHVYGVDELLGELHH